MITGESNFDEKNVEEMFNMCSTEQSCIYFGITCYKIGTLAILYLQHALAIHSTECILASFALLTRALSFDVVSKNMKCIFPFVASKLVRYQSFVLGCQVSK